MKKEKYYIRLYKNKKLIEGYIIDIDGVKFGIDKRDGFYYATHLETGLIASKEPYLIKEDGKYDYNGIKTIEAMKDHLKENINIITKLFKEKEEYYLKQKEIFKQLPIIS